MNAQFFLKPAVIDARAAQALPDLPVEAMYDYGFMRTRRASRYRHKMMTSKTLTHDIALTGKPGPGVRALVRVMVWGRRLRALVRGRPAIGTCNKTPRAQLARSCLWI